MSLQQENPKEADTVPPPAAEEAIEVRVLPTQSQLCLELLWTLNSVQWLASTPNMHTTGRDY